MICLTRMVTYGDFTPDDVGKEVFQRIGELSSWNTVRDMASAVFPLGSEDELAFIQMMKEHGLAYSREGEWVENPEEHLEKAEFVVISSSLRIEQGEDDEMKTVWDTEKMCPVCRRPWIQLSPLRVQEGEFSDLGEGIFETYSRQLVVSAEVKGMIDRHAFSGLELLQIENEDASKRLPYFQMRALQILPPTGRKMREYYAGTECESCGRPGLHANVPLIYDRSEFLSTAKDMNNSYETRVNPYPWTVVSRLLYQTLKFSKWGRSILARPVYMEENDELCLK